MAIDTYRILLVEDNPGDARLIQEALRETRGAAFNVTHTDTLAAALATLRAGGIDVVLLDLGLPDVSGLETLVRAHDAASGVPIVVLTGLDDEELAMRAVKEGAQDYLIKGLESGPLARAVRYAIERKTIEEELRESQDRLRTVIDNTPIVLFATDFEGRVIISQGRGLSGLGVRPGQVDGQLLFDLFPAQPEITDIVGRGLAGEEAVATVKLSGRAFDLHVGPLYHGTNTVGGVIGVATDITERVLANEALEETLRDLEARNQELEAFTYSVSHDLKEPLRTLEAFSTFVLEDYADRLDDQGKDYLRRMAKASARMKQMIEELLMLSRLGRRPKQTEPVSVRDVVHNIVAAQEATIARRNAQVVVVEDLPEIRGDVARVEQIFGNLMSNAMKFNTRDEPEVHVGLARQGDGQAVFYVRDNGIGIEDDYHAQVFGIFQRLHRREDYEGTGAGLAIVKRAAEALNGSVWLESTPDQGSTFFVALPLWEDSRVGTYAAA